MRLFEYQGGTIPDLRQYVTPQLVDEIIRDGKWVAHGSDLEDWFDSSSYFSDNADELGIDGSIEELPYEEAKNLPEFRKGIEHWLQHAIKQFEDVLHNGCQYDKIAPYGPETVLYRCMAVGPEWFDNSAPKMGIFWSAVPEQARRFIQVANANHAPLKTGHVNILMRVHAKDISVNWYETVRSRIDYGNGFDENEFQLISGSSLGPVDITLINQSSLLPKNTTKTGTA